MQQPPDKPPLFRANALPNNKWEERVWWISGDVGLVGNGSGPHKVRGCLAKERLFPRKSHQHHGHVCGRRKTSVGTWCRNCMSSRLAERAPVPVWGLKRALGRNSPVVQRGHVDTSEGSWSGELSLWSPTHEPDCWVRRAQHQTVGYSTAVMEGDVGGCWFSHVREVEASWKPQEIDRLPTRAPAILPWGLSAAG